MNSVVVLMWELRRLTSWSTAGTRGGSEEPQGRFRLSVAPKVRPHCEEGVSGRLSRYGTSLRIHCYATQTRTLRGCCNKPSGLRIFDELAQERHTYLSAFGYRDRNLLNAIPTIKNTGSRQSVGHVEEVPLVRREDVDLSRGEHFLCGCNRRHTDQNGVLEFLGEFGLRCAALGYANPNAIAVHLGDGGNFGVGRDQESGLNLQMRLCKTHVRRARRSGVVCREVHSAGLHCFKELRVPLDEDYLKGEWHLL